ncbi:hypothetical protein SELMODRAFT_427247 [Selaginella moellendorffii]|uniref:Uncharacterized protein n=1 Tax=Selaginella moellendorffii TaxID=88036 RepID=D8SZ03_SELML|nr:hypothetical protein SELMODRAFT_427247 [Selaginella moellendorffii]
MEKSSYGKYCRREFHFLEPSGMTNPPVGRYGSLGTAAPPPLDEPAKELLVATDCDKEEREFAKDLHLLVMAMEKAFESLVVHLMERQRHKNSQASTTLVWILQKPVLMVMIPLKLAKLMMTLADELLDPTEAAASTPEPLAETDGPTLDPELSAAITSVNNIVFYLRNQTPKLLYANISKNG